MTSLSADLIQPRAILRRLGTIVLWLTIGLFLVPFVFALITALRPESESTRGVLSVPSSLTLDNFFAVFTKINYTQSVANTLLILAGTCVLTVVLGAMASYPLSRIVRGWTNAVYRLFLVGTTVPIFVLLAPLYLTMRDLRLLDSQFGVIFIYTAMNLPIAVFFYTSFMRQIPIELEEAASIDGAGPLRVFFTMILPLLSPVTATLVTYLALAVWNDLVIPLVFLRGEGKRTIMANAYALIDPKAVDPTVLFSAALLGVLPLMLFFGFLQKYVVAGMTSGAVK